MNQSHTNANHSEKYTASKMFKTFKSGVEEICCSPLQDVHSFVGEPDLKVDLQGSGESNTIPE